jgi:transcriptional regulator GlxA family with amidase domain
MLEERQPGQSVTATAFACGFSNLGEFAGRYRDRFGKNPSETLKRAR